MGVIKLADAAMHVVKRNAFASEGQAVIGLLSPKKWSHDNNSGRNLKVTG